MRTTIKVLGVIAICICALANAYAQSLPPITGYKIVCPGDTTYLGDASWGGTWTSSNTSIATIGSSTAVVIGVSPGTVTISYVYSGMLATAIVTVNPLASGAISGPPAVDVDSTITLTDTSSGGGGTWSSSTPAIGSVTSSGVVTGVSTGTTTISYTASGFCGTTSATYNIVVTTPLSTPITGYQIVCPGNTTSLGNSSWGGTWTSGNTTIATIGSSSAVVAGVSPGTVTIYYVYSGMLATAVVTVVPLASGTISGPSTVNVGSTITLTDTSSGGGGTWSSSSPTTGSVSSSGVVTGLSTGATTISYTASGFCGTTSATYNVTVTASATYGKIPIDSSRWYQLDNTTNGLGGLFDGVLNVFVNTGYGKILTNFDAYYPLLPGEAMQIDSVRFYSGTGTSYSSTPFTLYYIDSAWNRVYIGSFIAGVYDQWVGPDTSNQSNIALSAPITNARYLLINSSSAYPNEMELYGAYIPPTSISPVPAKTIKLGQEMGVNGFAWDFEKGSDPQKIDSTLLKGMKSFTAFRHYLDWDLLEDSEGKYTFNPCHPGSWNLDTIYSTCKQEGIMVLADIKTQPDYMQASYSTGRDAENVPVMYGADYSDPASYINQAKVAFQFAGRYGSNTSLSTSLLSVDAHTRWTGDPTNVVKVGTGLVKYIECDNERDKWWKGRNAYQTGREYAANLSAFYDGNMNTMGSGVGVKNADTSMKVVMAGVAGTTTDWLRGMIDWCREYRGYKTDGSVNVCWDVVNYHIYPNSGSVGTMPETAQVDSVTNNFIQVAHTYLKDMPVWLTETGYDINQHSPQRAIPIGGKTTLQTQADWILRSTLLYARMGVDHVFYYEVDDIDTSSSTQYSSSGLLNPDRSRKPAADYLYQANHLMGNYVYQQTINTSPLVDMYTYSGDTIYALVKPSQSGTTVSYSLNVGHSGNVYIYTPTAGQDSMSVSTSSTSGTSISLTVTETPMFVSTSLLSQAARQGSPSPAPTNIPVTRSDIHIYPNPTTGNATLSLNSAYSGEVKLTICSEMGNIYNAFIINKTTGTMTQPINMTALPNGMYLLKIAQGSEQTVKKIIKVN